VGFGDAVNWICCVCGKNADYRSDGKAYCVKCWDEYVLNTKKGTLNE
jgi:hypothetical protein